MFVENPAVGCTFCIISTDGKVVVNGLILIDEKQRDQMPASAQRDIQYVCVYVCGHVDVCTNLILKNLFWYGLI